MFQSQDRECYVNLMFALMYEAQALFDAAKINYHLASSICPDSMFLEIRRSMQRIEIMSELYPITFLETKSSSDL